MGSDDDARLLNDFRRLGWVRFPADETIADWAAHAMPFAEAALNDPALGRWHDCEDTWFVGVDALPNDAQGRLGGGPPVTQAAWAAFWQAHFGPLPPLHRAQLSVIRPGYPRPRRGESEAAFGYRTRRHAAHVDGLLRVDPGRRRMIREPHAFILGLPLNRSHPDAASLMVWEGSHRIMGETFAEALRPHAPDTWPGIDVTEPYKAARRRVFEAVAPVALHAAPGEALLLHRHLLHGMGAWGPETPPDPAGRRIAYFRPESPGGIADWLALP